jgi:hypothetical protein
MSPGSSSIGLFTKIMAWILTRTCRVWWWWWGGGGKTAPTARHGESSTSACSRGPLAQKSGCVSAHRMHSCRRALVPHTATCPPSTLSSCDQQTLTHTPNQATTDSTGSQKGATPHSSTGEGSVQPSTAAPHVAPHLQQRGVPGLPRLRGGSDVGAKKGQAHVAAGVHVGTPHDTATPSGLQVHLGRHRRVLRGAEDVELWEGEGG